MTRIIQEPVLHSAYYGAFESQALAVKCVKSRPKLCFNGSFIHSSLPYECFIKCTLFFIVLYNTLLHFVLK